MHEGHPLHEGPSSQKGPPTWFLKYFEKLHATIERMEPRQEEQAK